MGSVHLVDRMAKGGSALQSGEVRYSRCEERYSCSIHCHVLWSVIGR